ncbi:TetR/AcrR family transcriptional regulator [Actinomadura graeca]|uniref:TetR/AcrR family transcriptional regulator n=1 Tax=Actinomadura graeca TaxID=2750812 RepID=A0ABX8QY29_9ACTN|nr:TetR/AcrR family transcriptional regulator [Actinomadura graeca]QXJ23593.1 TetR/AcrR family transcriptional regulator [Actinomadura graeca]
MPRADARRNRELLLAAARDVFADQGTDAPLDVVARRAGVGNATMYRHFPTRRDLLVAVYAGEVAALTAEGRDLLTEDPPADALFSWLRTFIAHVATKTDLARAIPECERSALFDDWHTAMHETTSALLARAQKAGEVCPDLKATDLLTLANGIALAAEDAAAEDAPQTDRLLRLVRQGTTP